MSSIYGEYLDESLTNALYSLPMSNSVQNRVAASGRYPISAAANLAGVSVHTVRKWENRHGAISPQRTAGGDRRYTDDDVQRLRRLKKLVDQGASIGSIAQLGDDDLAAMLQEGSTPDAVPVEVRRIRALVIDEEAGQSIWARRDRFADVDLEHLPRDDLPAPGSDLIVFEVSSLRPDTQEVLERHRQALAVRPAVVVYRYGAIEQAEALSNQETAVFSRPFNLVEVERAMRELLYRQVHPRLLLGRAPHRYNRVVLSGVAQMSGTIACECPQHVARLIIDLSDFESYSDQCEELQPHDGALHRMLARTSATARSLFEQALAEVAAAEGIDLEEMNW